MEHLYPSVCSLPGYGSGSEDLLLPGRRYVVNVLIRGLTNISRDTRSAIPEVGQCERDSWP